MSDKNKNWILAIVLTVAFIANSAFAKEINLECSYTNLKNTVNTVEVMLNPETLRATTKTIVTSGEKTLDDSPDVGRIVTTSSTYQWIGDFGGTSKFIIYNHAINRLTLEYKLIIELPSLDSERVFKGQCELIETNNKI